MTKRFVAYFDKDHNYIIQDLVNEDEYQVGFVNCDEDLFLELVNALAETSCDCITDCEIVMKKLKEENEQLKFENNELKCALALDDVDYIIADGKKIDIPPYYEFERRYDSVMHRREYDGYD